MRLLLRYLFALSALLVMLACGSAYLCWQTFQTMQQVQHTLKVLYLESELLSACQEMIIASRGYALTHRSFFKERYEKHRAIGIELQEQIGESVADNPVQQTRIKTFSRGIKALNNTSQELLAKSEILPTDADELVESQKIAMDEVRQVLSTVAQEEKDVLQKREGEASASRLFLWGSLAAIFLASGALIAVIARSLKAYQAETEERLRDLEEARQEVEDNQRIAENALSVKSRFLSTVSHEVRTPMAGVIGLVEIMHATAQTTETKNLSRTALEACKRLLQILNNLLDASKLNAGAVSLEHRFFSVRALIGDCVQLVHSEGQKKGLEVESEVDGTIPQTVCGDELRVRQVLLNLLFNAVKFTEQGRVKIQVSVMEDSEACVRLRFAVIDTGIGIKAEHKEQLFKPFVQAEDSTTRLFGGTGLGLSISRDLVHLMEGEIGVESEPGRGSTFWFTIPFRSELCKTE